MVNFGNDFKRYVGVLVVRSARGILLICFCDSNQLLKNNLVVFKVLIRQQEQYNWSGLRTPLHVTCFGFEFHMFSFSDKLGDPRLMLAINWLGKKIFFFNVLGTGFTSCYRIS